jgi:hypothetical protein
MTHRLQVKPALRLVETKPKQRKTWTKADYRRAQHTAKQEYLLKELVNRIMASDWDIKELALTTGVAHSTVERWLRGDTKFAITRTLTVVGKALGGTLGWTWK